MRGHGMTGNGTITLWSEIVRLGREQATIAGHVRELREGREEHRVALKELGRTQSNHARQIAELRRSRRSFTELVKSLLGGPRSLLIGWGLALGFATGNLTYSDLSTAAYKAAMRALGLE